MAGSAIIKTGVAVLAATSLILGNTPAMAATTADSATTTTASTVVGVPDQQTIRTLEQYVGSTADGWVLNAPESVLENLPTDSIGAIHRHISESAQIHREGGFVRSDEPAAQPTWILSGEHGNIRDHWWGYEIRMDGYLVGKLKAGLGVFGGGVALAKAIGVTAVSGTVGGIVIAAAALIVSEMYLCQDEKGWLTVYLIDSSWLPGTHPPYVAACNPFA